MENDKKFNPPKKPENTGKNEQNNQLNLVKSKKSAAERRENIARVIRELGLWNINKSKLAKEMNVSVSQIVRDIRYLIKKLPKNEVIESRKEILEFLKKSMKEIRKQIFDAQGEEKRKAIDRGIAIAKSLTEVYEAYGLKDPAIQKYSIDAGLRSYDKLRGMLDELENEKEET